MLRSRFVLLIAAAVALQGPGVAWAQQPAAPAGENGTEYKQHMENGVKLYQDKNYEAAIAEFEAAYRAKPKASPLVNISLCRKALFQYPQAIEALETALAKHGDTMEASDKKAAQDAIAEMRALLGYVKVQLSPPQAVLAIDGVDQPAGTAAKPIPLGPGSHRMGAHADGFAPADQTLTIVSGEKDRTVTLKLTANKGWVSARANDPKDAIAIDQKPRAYGQWTGFLDPGEHIVQFYRPGGATYSMQIDVHVGKALEVRPGVGGAPVAAAAPVVLPPEPPDQPPAPPPKPVPQVRGPFTLFTGSLLGPLRQPADFNAGFTTGAAGGIRIGYRVNTPASFDFMFEYGRVTVTDDGNRYNYSLSSARLGGNLRLMTPGKSIRFVGDIGGGMAHDSFRLQTTDGKQASSTVFQSGSYQCDSGCGGWNGFLLAEIGLEFELNGVLIGGALQNYFQSISGIDNHPFGTDALAMFGGGIRIGYALW